jgi:2-hydroxychromene-2-carboxylate isomerase
VTTRRGTADADLRFYFDPVCPFCWMTSKWVRMVAARREYRVDWRFIALRLVNARIDYAAHFPPEYEEGHTAGLRLLRVAARTRAEHGAAAVERLYETLGAQIFDVGFVPDTADDHARRGAREFVAPVLTAAGLPAELADALDDPAWDAVVQAETDEALGLAGNDVGTPILQFTPPDGPAFFGPVISRLPGPDEAEELWDHVVALARFPGFAELKRSLRELPQLRALGVGEDEVGVVQDWHGGSRRLKR